MSGQDYNSHLMSSLHGKGGGINTTLFKWVELGSFKHPQEFFDFVKSNVSPKDAMGGDKGFSTVGPNPNFSTALSSGHGGGFDGFRGGGGFNFGGGNGGMAALFGGGGGGMAALSGGGGNAMSMGMPSFAGMGISGGASASMASLGQFSSRAAGGMGMSLMGGGGGGMSLG